MAYTTGKNIQRYQRMSPDIQTEWGTFTNPNILYHPSEYKYRQPAVPLLARGRSDFIHPQPMGPQHLGGLGYVGDYVPGSMGQTPSLFSGDTIKTVLIIAGIAGALLVLYFLFRDKKGAQWIPPCEMSGQKKQRTHTRSGKKSLSRYARNRARDSKGRFI